MAKLRFIIVDVEGNDESLQVVIGSITDVMYPKEVDRESGAKEPAPKIDEGKKKLRK